MTYPQREEVTPGIKSAFCQCPPCRASLPSDEWIVCEPCGLVIDENCQDFDIHHTHMEEVEVDCCLFCGPGPHLPGCPQSQEVPEDWDAGR